MSERQVLEVRSGSGIEKLHATRALDLVNVIRLADAAISRVKYLLRGRVRFSFISYPQKKKNAHVREDRVKLRSCSFSQEIQSENLNHIILFRKQGREKYAFSKLTSQKKRAAARKAF